MFRLSSRFYASMPGASHRLYKYARYNSFSAPETKIENITKQDQEINSIKLDINYIKYLVEQQEKYQKENITKQNQDIVNHQQYTVDQVIKQFIQYQKNTDTFFLIGCGCCIMMMIGVLKMM